VSTALHLIAAAVAAGLALWANLDYLVKVRRGEVRPRLVSWAIWTAALTTGAAGSAMARQIPGAALSAAGAVTGAFVLVTGWRRGNREFDSLDAGAAIGGGAGLVLLAIAAADPTAVPVVVAVAIAAATDLAAFAPTFRNAWRGNEAVRPNVTYALGGAVALAFTDFAVPAGVIYPAYELAACALAAALAAHGLSPKREVA
jgi:hypothetical protein